MKKHFHEVIKKEYIYIVGMVLVIFLISSNIAWLNPMPGFKVHKVPRSVPFMWQYNYDSGIELLSAAYFPDIFKVNPTRTNRPVYPMMVCCLSKAVKVLLFPFKTLNHLEAAAAGYIILKLLVYLLGGIIFFEVLRLYIGKTPALFAVSLMLFTSFSIRFVATFHTCELQFINAAVMLFLFNDICKSYSLRKNIIYSLIIGILIMAKQNYAIYLAAIIFALLHLRFKDVIISVIVQFMPAILWLLFLKVYGLEYYSEEMEHSYVSWIFKEFLFQNPLAMFKILISSWRYSIIALTQLYSVWLFFAAFTLGVTDWNTERKKLFFFFLLCLLVTWGQAFAASRYLPYMSADISVFVFGMASWAFFYLLRPYKKYRKSVAFCVALCWLLINVLSFLNLPWVHPYDQPAWPDNNMRNYMEKMNDARG